MSPTDRLNRALILSKLIEECAGERKDRFLEYKNRVNEDELTPTADGFQNSSSVETFTILSTATMTNVTLCLLNILDGAMKEVRALVLYAFPNCNSIRNFYVDFSGNITLESFGQNTFN